MMVERMLSDSEREARADTVFTPAPGWVDFMSTGALSRHGYEAIEVERWERTLYVIQQPEPEWGACQQYHDGSWGCCNNYGGYWQRTCDAKWYPDDPVWRCP